MDFMFNVEKTSNSILKKSIINYTWLTLCFCVSSIEAELTVDFISTK